MQDEGSGAGSAGGSADRPEEVTTPVERWERRERKLKKRREGMKVSGVGLKKVLLPVLRKKAEQAERAAAERRRPKRFPLTHSPSSITPRRRPHRQVTA